MKQQPLTQVRKPQRAFPVRLQRRLAPRAEPPPYPPADPAQSAALPPLGSCFHGGSAQPADVILRAEALAAALPLGFLSEASHSILQESGRLCRQSGTLRQQALKRSRLTLGLGALCSRLTRRRLAKLNMQLYITLPGRIFRIRFSSELAARDRHNNIFSRQKHHT